jgi:inorganic pyrophosphatase
MKTFALAKQYLNQTVKVVFDRPLGTKHPKHGFTYEVNYGYVPDTKAADGEELDVYYLGVNTPLTEAEGKCIAIIHRTNDDDDKLVIVPEGTHISDEEIIKQVHFQEQWFQSVLFSSKSLERKGVIFIISRDNTFLLQLRDENSKLFKNQWCFPGGGSDGDEDYAQTLVREIKEEYEVDVKFEDCTFLMDHSMGRGNHVYICPIGHDQEPVLNEGADMKWMTMEEIKKLDIGYWQEDVVEALDGYLKNLV